MKKNSQLFQDIFAFNTAKNKSYIEIGAWKPEKYSNSFLLEKNGWKGFSIEIDTSKQQLWENHPERKNKIYWTDAINFDYKSALEENNMPMRVGYISVDIEPPENTFSALKKVLSQGVTADCITFEHDKYKSDIDYDIIVQKYLKSLGYKVAVKDVYRIRRYRIEGQKKKNVDQCFMETWFVKDDIEFYTQTWNEWLEKNNGST